ncbi:hypothetical protein V8E51_013584 [Hyaloscypha variabilis]
MQPFLSMTVGVIRSHSSPPHLTPAPRLFNFQERCAEQLFETSPELVDRFSETYDIFMLGPSFGPGFRAAVQRSYISSPNLLQDIYTVILTVVESATQKKGLCDQTYLTKGTRSLQKLRTARIVRIQDAFAILGLGQTLAAFELLTNCIGSISILRYALLSVQPWYGEFSRDSLLDPVTIAPILWDTICCLVRREIPILRFITRDTNTVDRVAGLCTTLLPIFYDLCVVNHNIKLQSQSGSKIDTFGLRQIRERLLSWTPGIPSDFNNTFSSQETLGMMTQALMYQTTGLLIAHRILNPLGILDDVAKSYANSILLNFTMYLTSVGPGTRLSFGGFPILMAALEIPDVPKEVWESISLLAAAPVCAAKISGIIEYVWMKRYCGSADPIFDLLDAGPAFTVVP